MLVPYCPQTCVQRNAASHPPCKQPKVRRLAGFVLLVGASMKQVDGFSAPAGALADWGPQTKAPHAGVALPADIDKTARAHPHQPKQQQQRWLWLVRPEVTETTITRQQLQRQQTQGRYV
eukprot:COSAG05_NODE_649_length_8102_cov_157.470823_3_plen_120_part_00